MGRKNGSTGNRTSHDEGNHQHFSHPHILKLVNTPAETLTCNACEQPNDTNKPFYGCNTCQYFLHENCFNAPPFLDHPSHSSHPLTLHPIPLYSTRSYNCKACGSIGNGFSFSCAHCEYDLHLHCASSPTEILLSDKHPHQLELFDGSPYEDEDTIYMCDICDVKMNRETWLYYCARCDFGSHLQCAISPEVGVFPRRQQQKQQQQQQQQQQNPSPNPNPNPNPSPNQNASTNSAVEMINEANEAHDRLIAAQIESRINAHARAAALDLWD